MRLKYVGSVWKIFKRDVKKKLVGSFDASGVKMLHCWILFVSVGNRTTSALELVLPFGEVVSFPNNTAAMWEAHRAKTHRRAGFHTPLSPQRRQTDGMCQRKRWRCKQRELGETKASQAIRGDVIDENSAPRTGMFDIDCASALFLCN